MDEDYPIPDMETIFHNPHGASYSVKIDLSDAYYQFELDEEAKDICTINTSQGLFKMCQLPQGLKNSSSIFQNCIESTLKGIKGVFIFQDNLLVYGATKEQFDKRMLDFKCQLREKILLLVRKSLTQNQWIALIFWDTPIQRRELHQIPNSFKKKSKSTNEEETTRIVCRISKFLRKNDS